jgi:hypothetical protein
MDTTNREEMTQDWLPPGAEVLATYHYHGTQPQQRWDELEPLLSHKTSVEEMTGEAFTAWCCLRAGTGIDNLAESLEAQRQRSERHEQFNRWDDETRKKLEAEGISIRESNAEWNKRRQELIKEEFGEDSWKEDLTAHDREMQDLKEALMAADPVWQKWQEWHKDPEWESKKYAETWGDDEKRNEYIAAIDKIDEEVSARFGCPYRCADPIGHMCIGIMLDHMWPTNHASGADAYGVFLEYMRNAPPLKMTIFTNDNVETRNVHDGGPWPEEAIRVFREGWRVWWREVGPVGTAPLFSGPRP